MGQTTGLEMSKALQIPGAEEWLWGEGRSIDKHGFDGFYYCKLQTWITAE
jgi:hypothetical protein